VRACMRTCVCACACVISGIRVRIVCNVVVSCKDLTPLTRQHIAVSQLVTLIGATKSIEMCS